ncbi:MAG TPA: AMP-dependent synthetase/ligase [Nocardioidaceae bacterium]|nr:AMP-dependent synthetase/ligase [Nocardioidaceae bacterium]
MREYSSPLTVDLPTTGNLTDDVVLNGREHPDEVSFGRRTADGWIDVTAAEFLAEVTRVAKGLVGSGIGEGDRVALMSRTRYEWTLLDYAIWFAGAVTVPIYETSSSDQIAWILSDSGTKAIVVETPDHAAKVGEAHADPIDRVWVLDDGAVDDLTALGAGVTDEQLEARRAAATPETTATLIYTSGTTGHPKGCVITHGNFMFELGVAVDELHELFEGEDASTLLFLPLAHVFARIIQIGAVKARARLGHSGDAKDLMTDLATFAPSFVLAVPRVFEKVFNTASQQAAADGRGRVFDLAANTAIAYSKALDSGRPGPLLRARHAAFDRLVYGRLRDALGGRCRFAVSGGAPLGERLGHFYRGIGLVVLEGYGLTETSGAVTANRPELTKIGTVGRPLPGTTIRVADDGEVLLRGGQVFHGYWNNREATEEVLTPNGWLSTGDLGEIDDEGFLRITGRKKEIIVTAGGKNVSPTLLEDRIRAHPLVSQCMVVGDGEPFIAALVTIDPEAFDAWAELHGKSGDLSDLLEDPELRAEVQTAVDQANKAVSQAESIRKFRILPDDWTEESGQLTPSLKLRRGVVLRERGEDVDALYGRQ